MLCRLGRRSASAWVALGALAFTAAFVFSWASGCADKKNSQNPGDDPTSSGPAPPSLSTVVGLSAVPASASAVIGIDVHALASSPVWMRALERMFDAEPGLQDELVAVLKACQLDLGTDVSDALIALIPATLGPAGSLLVVKGQFREGEIVSCLGKFLPTRAGGRLETLSVSGRNLYHQVGSRGPGVWFSFGGVGTALVASGRETLEVSLGTGPKLSTANEGLGRYLGRAKTDSDLWAVGEIGSAVGQALVVAAGGHVAAPLVVIASADLGAGLDLHVQLQMTSELDAKALTLQAKLQLQAIALVLQIDSLGRMVQKAELEAKGPWAQLRWSLSTAELQKLLGANLAGLGPTIDKQGGSDKNPAPKSKSETESEIEGKIQHGN